MFQSSERGSEVQLSGGELIVLLVENLVENKESKRKKESG